MTAARSSSHPATGAPAALLILVFLALSMSTAALDNGYVDDLWLKPDLEERTVDLNQDGRIDELRFTITVQVNVSWKYSFEGDLRSLDGAFLGSGYTPDETYSAGTHLRTIAVPGAKIALSGADGPYRLYVFAFKVYESTHDVLYVGVESRTYLTNAHAASEFDPPYVRFVTPFSDELQVDPSGRRVDLVVHVRLEVDQARPFAVVGEISGPGGLRVSSAPQGVRERVASAGPATWDLVFNGSAFLESRVDGPYVVNVSLFTSEIHFSTSTSYQTAAYNHTAFVVLRGTLDGTADRMWIVVVIAAGAAIASGTVVATQAFLALGKHRRRGTGESREDNDDRPPRC